MAAELGWDEDRIAAEIDDAEGLIKSMGYVILAAVCWKLINHYEVTFLSKICNYNFQKFRWRAKTETL